MLSVIKNFVITFCISIIIFGLIAYYVVNLALDSSDGSIFSPFDTTVPEQSDDTDDSGNHTADTDSAIITDQNGDPVLSPEDLNGSSFAILFIGVDYQPEIFDDYEFMPETEAEETSETTDPSDTSDTEAAETPETTDETAETEAIDETDPAEDPDYIGFPKQYREVNADSLTLVNISKETGQIVFLPIPSDTKVMYDGMYMKIGSLYSKYGGETIAQKVSAITGFNVKYYAAVTMDDLEAVIDAVEGIEYNVPVDMVYDDEELNLHINLSKGTTVLTGEQAVGMLRYKEGGLTLRRSIASGFLRAAISRMLPITNPENIEQIYLDLIDYIDTNFTISDILENIDIMLAYNSFRIVDIAYPGSVVTEGSTEYFIPDTLTAITNFKKYRLAD